MTDEETVDGSMQRLGAGRAEQPGDGLPDLALLDVGAGAAVRIRRRALDELERAGPAAHPARLTLWYRRAIEPAVLIGLGLGYCAWAAAGAFAVLH